MSIGQEKAALRRKLLALRREKGRDAQADEAILSHIAQSPAWKNASSVFAYRALSWEIGADRLLQLALSQGKRAAVPRCRENGDMDAVCLTKETAFSKSTLGISEPRSGRILLPEETDLVLVPALAFDRAGFRLGRGGGFYDRWLAKTGAVTIGLCYGDFLFDALPRDAHDIPVYGISTQEGLVWIKN